MESGMEAKALKSSFFSEYAMKGGNTQAFPDDFWCLNGVVAGEDFSIDEFFDLPNEENKDGTSSFWHGEEDEEEEKDESSLSMSSQEPIDDNHLNFSADLAVPVDDLQELELWSHFMDDSVPEATLACPKPTTITIHTQKPGSNRVEPGRKRSHGGVPFIPTAVPVKPRSKRPRTAWKTDSSGSAGSSSSTSASSSPVSTLFFPNPPVFSFQKPGPTVKKPKKKPAPTGLENGNPAVQRRCSHCQVTKTPQWRAGPNGPKTLCNACGVRFKSGRLFPEYRPACSPTFSSEIHSNSHRKVLEMRKMKEMTTTVESESGSTVTTMESIESS